MNQEERHIGRELHRLDNVIRRYLCQNSASFRPRDEVTGTNMRITRIDVTTGEETYIEPYKDFQ